MLNFPRWKSISILLAVVLGVIFALPNVVGREIWSKLPVLHDLHPLVLGLDLQGGSHVLLEVDRADLNNQLAKQLIGDIRQALREQKIAYSGRGRAGAGVNVRITNPDDVSRAMSTLGKLSQPVNTGFFGSGVASNDFNIR